MHRAPSVLLLGGLPLLPLKMWSGLFGGDGRTAQTNKMTGKEKKEQDSSKPLLRSDLGCGGIIPLLSLSSFSTRLPRYSSSSSAIHTDKTQNYSPAPPPLFSKKYPRSRQRIFSGIASYGRLGAMMRGGKALYRGSSRDEPQNHRPYCYHINMVVIEKRRLSPVIEQV